MKQVLALKLGQTLINYDVWISKFGGKYIFQMHWEIKFLVEKCRHKLVSCHVTVTDVKWHFCVIYFPRYEDDVCAEQTPDN